MFDKILQQLDDLPKKRKTVPADSYLFKKDDPVRSVHLLISGIIDLVRYQEDGGMLTVHRTTGPMIMAEASVYAGHYHCHALCIENAEIISIDSKLFINRLEEDSKLAQIWSEYLAKSLQAARHRSEILSRKTVAERLEIWLDWNNGTMPPKGQRKSLASELGVTPEALYRTLAKFKSNKS